MRRTKMQMTAAALTAAMLLGGCGEASYELTEAEENVIVNYSAHVVSKYNTYQKEGLTYVLEEDAEEEETVAAEDTAQNTQEVPAESTADAAGAETAVSETETSSLPTATLYDLFGEPGLEVNYVGARIAENYTEDNYYVMNPDTNKNFLILGIDITNTSDVPVDVDFLSKDASFKATLNGTASATAETSLSLGDFSTFDGILASGETKETILLFQVPEEITSIESIGLVVTIGESYQIIL